MKREIKRWICTANREQYPKTSSLDADCPTNCRFRHKNTAGWLDRIIEEHREIQGENLFNLIREVAEIEDLK